MLLRSEMCFLLPSVRILLLQLQALEEAVCNVGEHRDFARATAARLAVYDGERADQITTRRSQRHGHHHAAAAVAFVRVGAKSEGRFSERRGAVTAIELSPKRGQGITRDGCIGRDVLLRNVTTLSANAQQRCWGAQGKRRQAEGAFDRLLTRILEQRDVVNRV